MPYRTDKEALAERLALLENELSAIRLEVTAKAEKQAALELEVAGVRARLERDQNRASPLDSVRIAAPCHADWNAMRGSDRVRFCGVCSKNVFNVEALTRAEAELLLTWRETPCLRLYRREDGTILTSDCPVGVRRRRRTRIVAATVGGALVAGAMLLRWRALPQAAATCDSLRVMAPEVRARSARIGVEPPPSDPAPDPFSAAPSGSAHDRSSLPTTTRRMGTPELMPPGIPREPNML